uniref:PDEase domain-containing protein n=1 Tax=Zooxanthella nutricula TaxID=1333877 RepID=A0A6U9KVI6_9DINO|mmetsp:Transcript_84696/g.258588  ORF Transcript_84696/g.258588 Transcript_84696/m.258588 type:complete len:216 (+) Transcript_84696:2-649(+)
MFELVLGTDMADHRAILGRLQAALAEAPGAPTAPTRVGEPAGRFSPRSQDEAIALLQVAIKASDLGHAALGWNAHLRWVGLLEEEFFAQGDREKDMGWSASPFMDRDGAGLSEDQIPFFGKVVVPLFQLLAQALPESQPMLDGAMGNLGLWEDALGPVILADLERPRSQSEPVAEHRMENEEQTQAAAVRADRHAPRWGLKRFSRIVPSAGKVSL